MNEPSVNDLLTRLFNGGYDRAWPEFLQQFSPLIMQVVRRYETDSERASDCYLYACSALSDDAFQRLRKFRPDGPARFRTWLSAVVSNLCVDWTRKQHGRARTPSGIAELPELEQQVYHHIFVKGQTRHECLLALRPEFPTLDERRLGEINARLFSLLTPQQRFQLSVRRAAFRPRTGRPVDDDESPLQVEDPGPRPDELVQSGEAQLRLDAALAQLPPRQRLLLRLRFQQDLTLAEVARLLDLGDAFRAHRQIQAALNALAKLMT